MSEARKRILVIRRRALGDLVCSLPALEDLRAAFPDAVIDLVMDAPWVQAALAWAAVDRVLVVPPGLFDRIRFALGVRRAGYDLVVDLLSTPQTALLSWLTGARRRVGLDLQGRAWAYTERVTRPGSAADRAGRPTYVGDALRAVVAAALPSAPRAQTKAAASTRPVHVPPRLAIAPGATWSAKAWPAPAYAEVARLALAHAHAEVTVFWGPGEESLAREICAAAPGSSLAPGGTIVELGERLQHFDLLVSGDSGVRHLAHALGLRTVSVFGPTDPWTQTPPGPGHRFLRYPIACAPCQRAECALARNYCLTEITAEQVWEEAATLLSSVGAA
ncbi:MAG TPA: glycosyltransferase family 9 protein [Candidatus Eisenbacteria bacterium]|nr:glycosyltransferase family 9 protein [Candidatus Eisenbacteria bacterium]